MNSHSFQNSFLQNGISQGRNTPLIYFAGIVLILVFYILGGLIVTIPLTQSLIKNGYTMNEIRDNKNLLFDPNAVDYSVNFIMSMQFMIFVFTVLGIFLAILLHKRKWISFISGSGKFRWKYFVFAVLVWGMFNLLVFLNSFIFERENLIWNFQGKDFFIMIPLMLFFLPVQTFVEEFVFRSYLIQGLTPIFRNAWPSVIISAVLFSLSHASNPEIKAFGFETMLLFYFVFGFALNILALLTEGIEITWGLHFIHNFLSGLLITSENSVLKTNALLISKAQNAWAELIFVTAGLSFFILLLVNKFKIKFDSSVFK